MEISNDDVNRFNGIASTQLSKAINELRESKNFSYEGLKELHAKTFHNDGKRSEGVSQLLDSYAVVRQENPNQLWSKWRQLPEQNTEVFTTYSPMGKEDIQNVRQAINNALPENMSGLPFEEKINRLSHLYSEMDYLHSFNDGNSRINRAFVKEIAAASNVELDWNKASPSEIYVARDKSLAERTLERRSDFLMRVTLPQSGRFGDEEVQRTLDTLNQSFPKTNLNKIFQKISVESTHNQQKDLTLITHEATGKLVSYGVAPYPNSPSGAKSYFAEIQTESGENKKLWGKGISTALAESNARKDDTIHLAKTGNDGKQNTWKAEVIQTAVQQKTKPTLSSVTSDKQKATQQASQQHLAARTQQTPTMQPESKQQSQTNNPTKPTPKKSKDKGIER